MDEFNSIDNVSRAYEGKKEEEADEIGPDEDLYDCELPDLEKPSHAAIFEALEIMRKYSLFEEPSLPPGIAASDRISRTVEPNR